MKGVKGVTEPQELSLPESARRLFPHDVPEGLTLEAIIERLMEEGDRADLVWMIETIGETPLIESLNRFSGRRLSRRSENFWRLVLLGSAGHAPRSHELWPL